MDWLNQNTDALNALAGLGVLAVWALYATLFYVTYRRQTKPRIVIDQLSGPGADATCVVTNLSGQSLYLECVLALALCEDRSFGTVITEHATIDSHQLKGEIVSLMKRGPLEPGQLVIVGTLQELARRAAEQSGEDESAIGAVHALEIRVAAMTSMRDHPIGATKRFGIDLNDGTGEWQPARLGTTQLRSLRARREVLDWIRNARTSRESAREP